MPPPVDISFHIRYILRVRARIATASYTYPIKRRFTGKKAATMQRPLDNQHVIEIKPLPSPRTIKSTLPITDQAAALVVETRDAIRRILHGQDRERLLVIVGPCSIHDPEAAYEYADRLKPVADALRDRLLIVMRTYFEKPRTTVGWKGLINDPHLDGTCDIASRDGNRANDSPQHQQTRGPLRR